MDVHDSADVPTPAPALPREALPGGPAAQAAEPSARVRRHRRIAWIVLGVFLALIGLAIYRHRVSSRLGGLRGFGGPMPVSAAKVSTADVPVVVDALGTVTPLATVNVTPQVSGPLVRLPFKEGQMVRAGALLAEIDPRPYQAALDQARGELATAEAALATARIDLARYKRLLAQDSIAEQTYADQLGTVQQDAATVETDKALVETARLNLSYCRISAPVGGLVGLRQVDIGNLVQANQTTPIVVVTQMRPMSVLFSVPETDLAQIFRQMHSGQRLTVEAYSRDMRHLIATGTLAAIDNQINTTTGTLQMRALFTNSHLQLFPNEFVNVKLVVRTLKNQVVVPGAAVQNGPSGNFVYVVQPNDTVQMRTVVTGPTDGTLMAVMQGLAPGEVVVTDGADELRPGAKVRIPGAHPSAARARGAGAQHTAAAGKGRCARLAQARRTASGRRARFLARASRRFGCARRGGQT
jgi:multidrug efflux system membrane fusion protein